MQAVHVLNVVTVPAGAQMGTDSGAGEGRGDHTMWATVYDHRNLILYVRTMENQNLQRIELRAVDLADGAATKTMPLNAQSTPFSWDVAAGLGCSKCATQIP